MQIPCSSRHHESQSLSFLSLALPPHCRTPFTAVLSRCHNTFAIQTASPVLRAACPATLHPETGPLSAGGGGPGVGPAVHLHRHAAGAVGRGQILHRQLAAGPPGVRHRRLWTSHQEGALYPTSYTVNPGVRRRRLLARHQEGCRSPAAVTVSATATIHVSDHDKSRWHPERLLQPRGCPCCCPCTDTCLETISCRSCCKHSTA